MFSRKSLTNFAAAAVIAVGAPAVLAQNNPLDPSYFAGKTTAADSNSGANYADTRNPLHPMYSVAAAVMEGTAAVAVGAMYADKANPLYPGYRRF
jgi:hypothetical protein